MILGTSPVLSLKPKLSGTRLKKLFKVGAPTVHHQRNLNVWVAQTSDVHLLEVFGLQNDNRQLSCGRDVTQRETYVSQLVFLQCSTRDTIRMFDVQTVQGDTFSIMLQTLLHTARHCQTLLHSYERPIYGQFRSHRI